MASRLKAMIEEADKLSLEGCCESCSGIWHPLDATGGLKPSPHVDSQFVSVTQSGSRVIFITI